MRSVCPAFIQMRQSSESLINIIKCQVVESAAGFPRIESHKFLEGGQHSVVLAKLMACDSVSLVLDEPMTTVF